MDQPGAVDRYEAALDEFFAEGVILDEPTRARALEAFRDVDEITTERRDWKRQDRAYRRMLKRIPKGDPLAVHLWDALGEIYRTRLGHPESAISAFEVAHSLDPQKSADRIKILTELYALVGRQAPERTEGQIWKLVEADPGNAEAYRALLSAAAAAGRLDEAFCASRALVFLEKAAPGEERLYRQYQKKELAKVKRHMGGDTWPLVLSPLEDPVISSVFAMCWEAPLRAHAQAPRGFGLSRKHRLAVETDRGAIARIFRHVARILNVPLPDVYLHPKTPGRLLFANCLEKGRLIPSVIVGRDLMTGYRDTELAFSIARLLCRMRPAHILSLAVRDPAELLAIIEGAALLVGRPRGPDPEPSARAKEMAAAIGKHITQEQAELVRKLVPRLPHPLDFARWTQGVDATARRAALLVCGELTAAARMIAVDNPSPARDILDLVAYSVSPPYLSARRRLGVSIV